MNDHAVVLGAGIAGLVAAPVLAGQYAAVTVVERDRLPNEPIDRRGAPQGRHLHSLLSRGSQILDELLPGFLTELADAGALVLDDANLHRIHHRVGPYTFNRTQPTADPAALITYLASRPFLEFHLRRRVAALPNVTFLDGHDVGELVATRPDHVTGVTVSARDSERSETLSADLVVDATGRGTRTPLLLERLGYSRPQEQAFTVDGVYHSQQITIPDQDDFRERMILVLPEGKAQRGGLMACENDRWTLTIAGRSSDLTSTPIDFVDMRTLARDFVPPHVRPALDRAQPLTAVLTYRYPGGVWRRYDRVARYPKGLVVLGDALCSLNPINGQGMTMATLHAITLRAHLRHDGPLDPASFYAAAAAITKPVWNSNAHLDSTPATSISRRATKWMRCKILESAADDMIITERLMRVANFVDPPRRLVEPGLLARVAAHHAQQCLTRREAT